VITLIALAQTPWMRFTDALTLLKPSCMTSSTPWQGEALTQ
jgi:hypothetical protein